tara:strand:+ start:824 stop:1015 length:192 start_codon:yes stop_codon:yes gene_type:complete
MGKVSDIVIGLKESVTEDEARYMMDYVSRYFDKHSFLPHQIIVGGRIIPYHDYRTILEGEVDD